MRSSPGADVSSVCYAGDSVEMDGVNYLAVDSAGTPRQRIRCRIY